MNFFRMLTSARKIQNLFFLSCLLWSSASFSQNKSVPATVPTYYLLPAHISEGVLHMHVKFTYFFEKVSEAGKYHMMLRVKTIAEPSSQYGEYFYRYKDGNFSHNELAQEDGLATTGFPQIQLTNLQVEVFVNSGQNTKTKTILFDAVIGHARLWDVDASEDPTKYSLQFRDLKHVLVKNDEVVKKRVQNYLKVNQNRAEFKNYIDKANASFNSKNYTEAKFNYKNALMLFPNDQYAKGRLQQIQDEEDKLKSASLKKEANQTLDKKEPAKQVPGNENSEKSSYGSNKPSGTNSGNSTSSAYSSTTNGTNSMTTSSNAGSSQPANTASRDPDKWTDEQSLDYFNKNVLQNSPYNTTPSTPSNDKFTKTVNNLTVIGNTAAPLINNWLDQQQAKQQAEAEERRREAEIQREKWTKINSRKALFLKYPDGTTPLSSQAGSAREVYYFTYYYSKSKENDEFLLIYVSNVFAVARYADGSWPFKSSLMNKLAKAPEGQSWILIGYYTSKTEAEEKQNFFVNELKNNRGIIKDVSHAPVGSSESGATTDFWGNAGPLEKLPASADKQSEVPAKPAEQKEEVKYDFWGNPL
jgi:hypothetical protein